MIAEITRSKQKFLSEAFDIRDQSVTSCSVRCYCWQITRIMRTFAEKLDLNLTSSSSERRLISPTNCDWSFELN